MGTPKHGGGPSGSPWVLVSFVGALFLGVALVGVNVVNSILIIFLEVVFIVFFARHMIFAVGAMRSATTDLAIASSSSTFTPSVTVLVPCKNEESVVESLVSCLVNFDYPENRLQVIVIDDGSDDETPAKLDALAAVTPTLRILHRLPGAGGGKSGALNDALELATGEIIIVFDADHQPRRDVVWRLTRHFEDPGVGAVQGRCEIVNPDDSPLTRLIAMDYLAGYLVNEYGRQSIFLLPAYGGANCAVRASSLREVGGWNPDTVTEDTDLTLKLILSGQRVRYDVTAVDAEEGVVTVSRFWRQRYRWARGHQQVWRDYRQQVLTSRRLTVSEKVETIMFLLVFHMPVFSFLGLVLLIPWMFGVTHPDIAANAFVLWTLLFLGPLLELGGGLLLGRAPRRWVFSLIYFLPLFFVSIALCTKAWVDGLLGRPYTWVKTSRAHDPSSQGAP